MNIMEEIFETIICIHKFWRIYTISTQSMFYMLIANYKVYTLGGSYPLRGNSGLGRR